MKAIRKIYIAGPMTGIKDHNFPAFNRMAKMLRADGHVVINPADLGNGLDYDAYMDIDIACVRAVDVLVVLPGWESSNGALAEITYAKACRKRIIYVCDEMKLPFVA